ncbi:hypothetical protein [Allostreptomyces psammosilenae]|uniref:Uncharacterized protein n=1 Tax=Allostreptomyces psammosilenae TaxID=1892865 RepID=A0A853A138_9ACTN|nr:hypothetical protein [Allostreptomyces psammosilenae]NYI08276.1 hypothetical protein [Allostreptomyces psammosilenae]
MTQPSQRPGGERARGDGPAGRLPRLRPAPLLFEPAEPSAEPEHFFDLDTIHDPQRLLERSTELVEAFRAAADRAMEFQAMAAAQLAAPERFDRLTAEQVAERADWTPEYAAKMIEYGRDLQNKGANQH